MNPKVGGLPGGGMPGQGKDLMKAKRNLYALSLEIEAGHLAGGTVTVTVVLSVWDTHTGGQTL